MTNPGETVDDAEITQPHAHGPLSELIFLLRTFEERCRRYEQLLKLKEDENAVLAAFNREYHERLNAKKEQAA